MLSSLLPGLRDIRTPLTVGYLWLFVVWLGFGERLPRKRPSDGVVAKLFDLESVLGKASALAALSFVAYVLGCLLTIPTEGAFGRWLRRLMVLGYSSSDVSSTSAEFRADVMEGLIIGVSQLRVDTEKFIHALTPRNDAAWSRDYDEADQIHKESIRVARSLDQGPLAMDLRIRLLVRDKELYGEYDRLAAEGAFRINLLLPFVALAVVSAEQRFWAGGLALVLGMILFVQGVGRIRASVSVLERAVLTGVIEMPQQAAVRELRQRLVELGRRQSEVARNQGS